MVQAFRANIRKDGIFKSPTLMSRQQDDRWMIDGKQCTICWLVEDLEISHKMHRIMDNITDINKEQYGKMMVTHQSKHAYV